MGKCGTTEKHCCWHDGHECEFLTKQATPGFLWSCSLRAREGSWEKVYETEEYKSIVKPRVEEIGCGDCNDWPYPGYTCNDCGEIG